MGAALADQVARRFKNVDRVTLLMAGLSAGFGSVFGVPFAGTIFGLEVLAIGGMRFRRLLECAVASFIAHFVCLAWGVHHTQYPKPLLPDVTVSLLGYVVIAGLAFGLVAFFFSYLIHRVQNLFHLIKFPPLRALIGGALVVAGYYFVSWNRYAGLGIDVIEMSLRQSVPALDWVWKSVFTILTLASGMKGGEVTPLLFIGSTFGNFLSHYLPVAVSLLAALGFAAVFAGAANTPLACTLMAMELFGPGIGLLALVACSCAWLASGHRGIYSSQKIARMKPLGFRLK
jgi:H+/Cl- antiporter ClcA